MNNQYILCSFITDIPCFTITYGMHEIMGAGMFLRCVGFVERIKTKKMKNCYHVIKVTKQN